MVVRTLRREDAGCAEVDIVLSLCLSEDVKRPHHNLSHLVAELDERLWCPDMKDQGNVDVQADEVIIITPRGPFTAVEPISLCCHFMLSGV